MDESGFVWEAAEIGGIMSKVRPSYHPSTTGIPLTFMPSPFPRYVASSSNLLDPTGISNAFHYNCHNYHNYPNEPIVVK